VDDKVNLSSKLRLLEEPYSPGIVGYLNDYKLRIQLRDRDVVLNEGELFVVPRGVEHCPSAEEETHVLLIEPRGTVNTGDAGGELTAPEREI
jgi:hypothetical protein